MVELAEIGAQGLAWWLRTNPTAREDGRIIPGIAGIHARIRRARTPHLAVLSHEEVIVLHNDLGFPKRDMEISGAIAAVLALVKYDDQYEVAFSLARGGKFSAMRFRCLMTANTPERMLTQFQKVVRILDRKASVSGLTEAMAVWCDPFKGPEMRRHWMYNFHCNQ